MKQWHDILCDVLRHGTQRNDRTGVGTLAVFGRQLTFDLRDGFPAVTTKKLAYGQVAAELCAFTRGYSNLDDFHKVGCSIWDGNGKSDYWLPRATCQGSLGRIYGVQWTDWRSPVPGSSKYSSTNQLRVLVDGIKKEPHGRRHLVTAWNPGELDQMCLPPCYVLFQCFVEQEFIDLRVDMRSVDLFLGLPFDVASFATLQHLLAQETCLQPRHLVFQLGDAHIYKNHFGPVHEVLANLPCSMPALIVHPRASLFNWSPIDVALTGYKSHGTVAAPLNV
jgi:thymidylate synthase